jgi:hypothetical protein
VIPRERPAAAALRRIREQRRLEAVRDAVTTARALWLGNPDVVTLARFLGLADADVAARPRAMAWYVRGFVRRHRARMQNVAGWPERARSADRAAKRLLEA